ncbi:hypothetical protein SEA_PHABULOSO_77 [Gordonia phage Phabuloso]|nr:hypothetical protein SEA_PHABULOSO_77 [Gordonia phage Phabuloso]
MSKRAFDGQPFSAGGRSMPGVNTAINAGIRSFADGGKVPAPIRIVVTRSRKGFQWAQIARNGSAGAISPKTYDTKSNAVRAARRQAALVGGVVEVQ